MNKRVLLGMSGGIDSSVAAALLSAEGYTVIGCFFHFWSEENNKAKNLTETFPKNKCCSEESLFRARQISAWLGIDFHTCDIRQEFHDQIVVNYLTEHQKGNTPNPCVECNRHIKFGAFLAQAKKLNCDFVATGHYAQITKDEDNIYHLHQGIDITRDQSYFLYTLTQDKLAHIILPLGGYHKTKIRQLAVKYGFAAKYQNISESQDLCFYSEKSPIPFLKRHLRADLHEGNIITTQGQKLGIHHGLALYTIGQRRGLNISGSITPLFVINKNSKTNELIVGHTHDLLCQKFSLRKINFIYPQTLPLTKIKVQIRYHSQLLPASFDGTTVILDEANTGISSGQSCVLICAGEILGGGIIIKS